MIRACIILALVAAVSFAARSFLPDGVNVTGSGAALAFGFLLLAAIQTGHVFHALKLPHLTGFLLCGALFGPEVLGLLTKEMIVDLRLVKKVAVALIALTAGCELNFKQLRPQIHRIGLVSFFGMVLAAIGLGLFFFFALGQVEFGAGMSVYERLAVSLLAANVLCALSPAVVMGLLSETRSAGPMSQLVLAIVVLADLVIAVTLAFSESLALAAFPTGEGGGSLFGALFVHIIGSLLAGALVGGIFAVYILRVGSRVGLFVFAVCFVVAEAGMALHLDPLLIGLSAGLCLENVSPIGGHRVIHETEVAAAPTFAVFFAVVGAEVHLHAFLKFAPWAVGAALTRGVLLYAGARFGAGLAGLDPRQRNLLPVGMLPQAGIAIAFASLIAQTFGKTSWGVGLSTLMLGTIVVNELVGPVLFRWALVRSGEAGAKADGVSGHASHPSLPPSLESPAHTAPAPASGLTPIAAGEAAAGPEALPSAVAVAVALSVPPLRPPPRIDGEGA